MHKPILVTPNYLRHLGISTKEMTDAGIPLDLYGNAVIDTEDRVQIALGLVRKRGDYANG